MSAKRIDVDEIVRLYSQGVTWERIAAEFGIDVETAQYLCDRAYMRWGAQYGYDD